MHGNVIDMTFAAFLTLLVISFIAALIVHFAVRYRFLTGADGFLSQWVVGWLGAWMGTPVLGTWFMGVKISSVYIIPAFIGGFAGAFFIAAMRRARARAHEPMLAESSAVHRVA